MLCLEAARWLRRRKHSDVRCNGGPCPVCGACGRYRFIAVELCVTGAENADVWGYDGYSTVVVEVKVSHADFLSDRKKQWRSVEPEYRAGNRRWYLCPEGVISPEELPEGWGLLYWDGRAVFPVAAPDFNVATGHADMRILYSILRREGFPEKVYNYRGAPTTIHPKR